MYFLLNCLFFDLFFDFLQKSSIKIIFFLFLLLFFFDLP